MNGKNGAHELAVDCIYTALIELMKTKPYKEITITDITKRAGVSRMAYYRNFNDKDEILTNHLTQSIEHFVECFQNQEAESSEKLWKEFFVYFKNDPVIENVVKAGLVDKLIEVHRNFTLYIYENIFDWDLSDEKNMMKLYQEMGSVVGLLLYIYDHNRDADTDKLTKLMIEMTSNGYSV